MRNFAMLEGQPKQTLAATVLDRIRDAIVSGLLVPGSHIDQMQLASDLRVSLVPVREALKKLEGEGFVQIIPRRGAFVAHSSQADMRELYFAREVIEGQAAYYSLEGLGSGDLSELERLAEQMHMALISDQYEAFLDLDRSFHFLIYRSAGSHYLTETIQKMWELTERYRFRYLYLKEHAQRIHEEHYNIIHACCSRDKDGLQTAVMNHVSQTYETVRSYLMFQQPEHARPALSA
jgi:DNA-binding GntR family transcriptional regulator